MWGARAPRHIRDVTRPYRIYFRRKRMRAFLRWIAVSDHTTTRRLTRHFSLWGYLTKPSQADVDQALRTLTLLDESEMRELFPDAKIVKERFLGMVKSLIAVRP